MSPLGTADSARQQLHKRWLLLERKRNIIRKAALRFAFYFLRPSNGRSALSVLMSFDQTGWLGWVCCAFSLLAAMFALLLSLQLHNLLEPAHLLTLHSSLACWVFFFLTYTVLRSRTYTCECCSDPPTETEAPVCWVQLPRRWSLGMEGFGAGDWLQICEGKGNLMNPHLILWCCPSTWCFMMR